MLLRFAPFLTQTINIRTNFCQKALARRAAAKFHGLLKACRNRKKAAVGSRSFKGKTSDLLPEKQP